MYLCVCACSMCVSLIYFSEYVANFQLFLLNQSEIASLYTVFDVQELSTPLNVFTHNTDVVSCVCGLFSRPRLTARLLLDDHLSDHSPLLSQCGPPESHNSASVQFDFYGNN